MAFNKKTWADRVSEFPNRFNMTDESGNNELVSLTRANGSVSVEGQAFDAANMNDLEERIEEGLNGADADILATKEEVVANTEAGKVADALVTKSVIDSLTANGNGIVMDYHDGKYGINTNANRGADTFIPFKSDMTYVSSIKGNGVLDCTSIPNYDKKTVDDFVVEPYSYTVSCGNNDPSAYVRSWSKDYSISKTYDSTLGKLTLNGLSGSVIGDGNRTYGGVNIAVNVYVK